MIERVLKRGGTIRERRRLRKERWLQPLTSPADRRAAWVDLLTNDHGVLRLLYRNRAKVSPRLWRSAQPFPADIAAAKALGVRTVLSLRDPGFGGDPLERAACERHGLAFERLILRSRMAPPLATLREAIERLPALEPPILVHCKSGADRAGLAAALYLLIVEKRPAREAKRQLSLRFGHVASAKTGILDAFLQAAEAAERDGLSFERFVEEAYDPDALSAAFRSRPASDLVLSLLRRE